MNLYAIILIADVPGPDPWDTLREYWTVHRVLDHRVAFVGSDDPNETTGTIAAKMGIDAEGRSGVVISAESLSGYGPASLAEWIRKHRD